MKKNLLVAAGRLMTAFCAVVSLAACSPASLLNVFVPSEGYKVEKSLAYGDDARHKLDLYIPAESEEPLPVIVFFYGGSWDSGNRQDYLFMGEALASQGFLVAIPDYRIFPNVRFPAFVEDGALALRWLTDDVGKFGGDPEKIIMMGHSAGAHIAALLVFDERYLRAQGLKAEDFQAFVGLSGPYAFDPLAYDSTEEIFATAEDADEARPVTFVSGKSIPVLLLHGGNDTTVLPINSQKLAEKVRSEGGKSEYREYPGTGHASMVLSFAAPFRSDAPIYAETIAYLKSL